MNGNQQNIAIKKLSVVSINLSQLIETWHNMCRRQSLNPEHPIYSFYKCEFLNIRLFDQKKKKKLSPF